MAKGPKPETGEAVGKIKWLDQVADHDYAAAEAYLSLKLDSEAVQKAIHASAGHAAPAHDSPSPR
jgi:hypothetical protein